MIYGIVRTASHEVGDGREPKLGKSGGRRGAKARQKCRLAGSQSSGAASREREEGSQSSGFDVKNSGSGCFSPEEGSQSSKKWAEREPKLLLFVGRASEIELNS